jgi:protoheme IX farnesyltransferase
MFKAYYQLTKPGIIYGNAITAIGGFFLASRGHVDLGLFVAMLVGLCLVIASGCVFNNYIDRDIDHRMARTKKRALVMGDISGRSALIYATILGLLGAGILGMFTNILTLSLALLGFFFYVVVYSMFWKRRSVHGTVVGSISGAIPPVVGYCAVTNSFDVGAVILFLILVCWQMPHFYAIAIYRQKEYAEAGVPVLPIVKGIRATKIQIVAYIAAFIIATMALVVYIHMGVIYFLIMTVLGLMWLSRGMQGFKTTDDAKWARKVFLFSLILITAFSVTISLDAWLI